MIRTYQIYQHKKIILHPFILHCYGLRHKQTRNTSCEPISVIRSATKICLTLQAVFWAIIFSGRSIVLFLLLLPPEGNLNPVFTGELGFSTTVQKMSWIPMLMYLILLIHPVVGNKQQLCSFYLKRSCCQPLSLFSILSQFYGLVCHLLWSVCQIWLLSKQYQ